MAKNEEIIIENGQFIKNKLTGLTGIVIDNNRGSDPRPKVKICYAVDDIPVANLIGKELFNYAGKVCFCEYIHQEELEIIPVLTE